MTQSAAKATIPVPKPSFIALLIAVSAVSPLGMNMYLPSMPGIARALGTDYGTIQLTLSLYLAAMALGQLIMGPLSDRFGRRPVLLAGLVIFMMGSLVCLLAPNSAVLILGRVVQGIGGCAGVTLSRAIVRDLYERNQVASMIGYVTMGMAVAPMVAPTIGGVLDVFFGWRASFAFLMAFGGIALFFTYWKLYETRPSQDAKAKAPSLLTGYGSLLRSRLFWGYVLTASFNMAMFYAFVAGAPYVMIELLGRSPAEYGVYFALIPGGYIAGSLATGGLARRFGANWMLLTGACLSLIAVAVMALLFAKGVLHPAALFVPMFFISAGQGIVFPSGVAGAVSVKPDFAGAAAGLAGSVQIGFGALLAPIVGATLVHSVWPLIIIMAVCGLLTIASLGLIMRP